MEQHSLMRGIVYMMIAIALLSAMDAIAKWLAMSGIAVMQILAIRSVIIVPLMLGIFKVRNELPNLKPKRVDYHVLRGFIGFLSPLCFFIGLKHIPITDAVALFFSSVFIITLFSHVFLKEKVGPHRWASIAIGFIGVLIVASPKGGGQLWGYLMVFLGSSTYAMLFVSGRYLSATESVGSLVFSFNLSVGAISLLLLPWFWQPIQIMDVFMLVALALLALGGHYLITLAFSISEASLVAPFEYTGILWAIVLDFLIWQILPSTTTALGATIIIFSGLYIAYRERMQPERAA